MSITLGLRYSAGNIQLHGYTNADWAGNVIDKKSTSRCFFSLGFSMIAWRSQKQKYVALGIAEEEYIVASMGNYEAYWLRNLFGDLFELVLDTTRIYFNN